MFIFGGVDILMGFMPFDPYEISFIGLTILTFLFTIFGFNQPSIFEEVVKEYESPVEVEDNGENRESNGNRKPATKKYARSGLKEEDVGKYLNRIEEHMTENKPYLNRELNIYDLASQLNIPRHFLSELINEHMGKNFYSLVNDYRIEEVKKRIANPKYRHLTILAIAYDAGFNAKSSFNTVFKEKTGMTPSEYQQSVIEKGS
jgi:AraC-like DNA-binding protein